MATVRNIFTGINAASRALGRSERLISAPRRDALVGEYLFGRDASTSRFNLTGGPNLAFVGSPVFSPRYALFSQTAWADTGLYDTADVTLLVVSSQVSQTAPLIGNYNGANSSDTTTFNLTGGDLQGFAVGTDNAAQTASTRARTPVTDFTVKVLRVSGGANFAIRVDEFRQGAKVGGTAVTTGKTRKVTTSQPFAIGSSRGASDFGGNVYVAGAAIWSRALTDSELLAEAAAISAKMAAWPQQSVVC